MNVSGPLLLLLLTAACTVSGEGTSRNLWQFGQMIRCYQPGVNPLKYDNYGCYCGYGGYGSPVDRLDWCCKVHDACYTAQMRHPQCRGFSNKPHVITYGYSCSGRRVTCSARNNYCQRAACECDRAAALCFSRTSYNPRYKNLDKRSFCRR